MAVAKNFCDRHTIDLPTPFDSVVYGSPSEFKLLDFDRQLIELPAATTWTLSAMLSNDLMAFFTF